MMKILETDVNYKFKILVFIWIIIFKNTYNFIYLKFYLIMLDMLMI